jgi:hypothetical protein
MLPLLQPKKQCSSDMESWKIEKQRSQFMGKMYFDVFMFMFKPTTAGLCRRDMPLPSIPVMRQRKAKSYSETVLESRLFDPLCQSVVYRMFPTKRHSTTPLQRRRHRQRGKACTVPGSLQVCASKHRETGADLGASSRISWLRW